MITDSDGEYVKVFRCGICRDEIRKMLGEQYGIEPINWIERRKKDWCELMEFARTLKTEKSNKQIIKDW
jgi:hypothetical protein